MEALQRAQRFSAQNYQGESALIWHRLPVSRRALVFVLLFLGQLGELRVVLTKRLSRLRNFPGHISLPGGKADLGLELPWMVARRETSEEIGLSENNAELLSEYGFTIDNVTELPCYLSRTFSAVKPCVGFLNVNENESDKAGKAAVSEEKLLHRLKLKVNPGESSSIFLCPLADFLYPAADTPAKEAIDRTHYRVKWGGIPWNLRSYTFPQLNPHEVHWLQGFHDLSASEEEAVLSDQGSIGEEKGENGDESGESGESGEIADIVGDSASENVVGSITEGVAEANGSSTETSIDSHNMDHVSALESLKAAGEIPRTKRPKRDLSGWGKLGSRRDSVTNEKIYDVWGLTANILHDLAEIVYLPPGDRPPLKQYGEEEMIWSVWNYGQQMRTKERSQIEADLISAGPTDKVSFGDLLPRTEFNRLKRIYKM